MPRCCLALFALFPLAAQNITLTGAGYADPTVLRVAPGQVVTLFAAGLHTVLPNLEARPIADPLADNIAGISVTLNQPNQSALPVPLLSIRQLPLCSSDAQTPSCLLTAITVQIPFELTGATEWFTPTDTLTISENGGSSQATRVYPVPDNIHILTNCDVATSPETAPPCSPIATHASGALITAAAPAHPGEEIVLWSYGLGLTSPQAVTGESSPTPAAVLALPLALGFDFTPNASPSRPVDLLSSVPPAPVFAGLSPGQFGLYQINVVIPTPAEPGVYTLTCPAVASNLTINLAGQSSFDGAPICVQPNP